MSNLAAAVDKAVAAENKRFLSSPAEMDAARMLGDLYRRVYEATQRGFVQNEGETLQEFVDRANAPYRSFDKQGEVEPFDVDADWDERS